MLAQLCISRNHLTNKLNFIETKNRWTIKKNSLAPEAAGKIHTDFQKGFIRAEVISYDDYVNLKGTANSKNEGKMRLEGKDYKVNEGDIVVFRYNV